MQVLAVEGVLQELYNIVSDGMLRREAFRPSQNLPLVERGLLDWKGEGEAKIDDLRVIVGFRWVWRLSAGYVRACGRLGVCGEEGIDGIRQVIFLPAVSRRGGGKEGLPTEEVGSFASLQGVRNLVLLLCEVECPVSIQDDLADAADREFSRARGKGVVTHTDSCRQGPGRGMY